MDPVFDSLETSELKLRFASFMDVMDACTRAGFDQVSVGLPPDFKE